MAETSKAWIGYVLEPDGSISFLTYGFFEAQCKAKVMAALVDDKVNGIGWSEAGYVGRVEVGAQLSAPFHESPHFECGARFVLGSHWEPLPGTIQQV